MQGLGWEEEGAFIIYMFVVFRSMNFLNIRIRMKKLCGINACAMSKELCCTVVWTEETFAEEVMLEFLKGKEDFQMPFWE